MNLRVDSSVRARGARLRFTGYSGIPILGHRAFRTLQLRPVNLVSAVGFAVVLTAIWLTMRPAVGMLWASIIEWWIPRLRVIATVSVIESQSLAFPTAIPHVDVRSIPPTTLTLVVTAVVTLIFVIISFRLPMWLTPIRYLIRAFCFIQATALIYFSFFAKSFPHDLSSYIDMMLNSTMAFITGVPIVLAFTFYLFDIRLAPKLVLTVMAMLHMIVLTPLQYLVHIYVISKLSVLFMPLLYTAFGLFPQIAVFIAFYSWGMSWTDRKRERNW